jgi:hypothetical protein
VTTIELTDDELLQRFRDTTLAADLFNHRQHVRTGWLFVRQYGLPDAIGAFSRALQHFANAKGAHNLFHVTITWAYLLLINERQEACGASEWEVFARANADLLTWKPSVLDAYYTPETLWSDRARRSFVMPDRITGAPLLRA